MTKLDHLLRLVSGALLMLTLLPCSSLAQKKATRNPVSTICGHDRAVQIIQEQIALTKAFDDPAKKITVLIRAADLLWTHENGKARVAFVDAFDLATQDHKEKIEGLQREGAGPFSEIPDQRYAVIAAIGKRDLAWARKLSDQMLDDEAREEKKEKSPDSESSRRTNEKLLTIALGLLPDQARALNFARSSLRYAASLFLPIFLFKLAEVNNGIADQFYEEALVVYASKPMEEFLYLSSYPFANDREVGLMPGSTIYRVPVGFAPNPRLERLFVQKLLARAQSTLSVPFEEVPGEVELSDSAQIWLALTKLERQIQVALPDMAPAVSQARGNLFPSLPRGSQERLDGIVNVQNRAILSFDEQMEAAERATNPAARERQLASAILGARTEDLDRVLRASDKISDSNLRDQVVGLLYFFRAQAAIRDKKLDEARKLAEKVGEIDRRAYLYLTIAEEFLKTTEDQGRARETLEEVSAAAKKAPSTIVTARALLGLAHLFSKIDGNRSIELLGNAVSCINRLEAPDFSSQVVQIKVEGKGFGFYTAFQTPGFSPENGFREVGKADFDGVLYQAASLTDKSLRTLTTLALVEPCLNKLPLSPPARKPKK
ncbi:MAG: hypothetical protein ND895_19260 [Pyrinomonadaceae bacterium]|nr:hypothetical protein [Pyrinomonadaceae bacterium]